MSSILFIVCMHIHAYVNIWNKYQRRRYTKENIIIIYMTWYAMTDDKTKWNEETKQQKKNSGVEKW